MRSLWKTAVLLPLAFIVAARSQASDSKEIHQTIPLDRDGRLSIDTYKGSITVTTWDRPEVEMGVRIDPDGVSSDEAEMKKVALTDVKVSGSGHAVTIRSDYDALNHLHFFLFHSSTLPLVHYTIQMPATAQLSITDYKSETRISDLKADLRLETYKGSAAVAHLDGAARIETYRGEIRVDFARFSKASSVDTYKGDIELRLPRDSRFNLDSETGQHGDVDSEFGVMSQARHSTRRTSGAVNGGGPTLTFKTYKGSLRLRAE